MARSRARLRAVVPNGAAFARQRNRAARRTRPLDRRHLQKPLTLHGTLCALRARVDARGPAVGRRPISATSAGQRWSVRPETGEAGAAWAQPVVDSARNFGDWAGGSGKDRSGKSNPWRGRCRDCATGTDRVRELQHRASMRGAMARRMPVGVPRLVARAITMDVRLCRSGKSLRHFRADRDGENPRGHGDQRHYPAPAATQPELPSTADHHFILRRTAPPESTRFHLGQSSEPGASSNRSRRMDTTLRLIYPAGSTAVLSDVRKNDSCPARTAVCRVACEPLKWTQAALHDRARGSSGRLGSGYSHGTSADATWLFNRGGAPSSNRALRATRQRRSRSRR